MVNHCKLRCVYVLGGGAYLLKTERGCDIMSIFGQHFIHRFKKVKGDSQLHGKLRCPILSLLKCPNIKLAIYCEYFFKKNTR